MQLIKTERVCHLKMKKTKSKEKSVNTDPC